METDRTTAAAAMHIMSRHDHGMFGRWRWRLWAVALDIAILGAIAALWYWPLVKIRAIEVDGPTAWHDDARAAVHLPSDSNLLHTDTDAISRQLAAVFNDRALCGTRVQWPGTLVVRLVPLAPVLRADGTSGPDPLTVAASGALMAERPDLPALPIWRAAADASDGRALGQQAKFAAGSWAEVLDADDRYQHVISEWRHSVDDGWAMIATDGRSQVLLGKTGLNRRAAAVAQLLERGDSLLLHPCMIDARFVGLLAVRPLAEPDDSSAVDSSAAGPPDARAATSTLAKSTRTPTSRPRPPRARLGAKGTT